MMITELERSGTKDERGCAYMSCSSSYFYMLTASTLVDDRRQVSFKVLSPLKSIIAGMEESREVIPIEKQLSMVIERARRVENIASTYEGWMPWI